jgi:hypothetical protein
MSIFADPRPYILRVASETIQNEILPAGRVSSATGRASLGDIP